eukprot:scaffold74592_cov65-Phaeocystis_antarctica.AAC.4
MLPGREVAVVELAAVPGYVKLRGGGQQPGQHGVAHLGTAWAPWRRSRCAACRSPTARSAIGAWRSRQMRSRALPSAVSAREGGRASH